MFVIPSVGPVQVTEQENPLENTGIYITVDNSSNFVTK